MRLGSRAGAFLGSVCSGPSQQGCPLLGPGEGMALGGGPAEKVEWRVGPGNRKHPFPTSASEAAAGQHPGAG